MASPLPTQAETWERLFPLPSALKCPRCSTCMWNETSYARHVRQHYPTPPVVKWVCDVCRAPFDTKQAVAQHYRSHSSEDPVSPGHTSQSSPTDPTSRLTPTNNYSCEYCENSFPTRIGLRNHERARHQALVSASLSRAVSALTDTRRPSTQWSDEEVAKFLAAVNKYGLKHTSLIAQFIGTRTATQVTYFKAAYKKRHPIWAMRHLLPVKVKTTNQGTQSSPSTSPSSSPSMSSSSRSPTLPTQRSHLSTPSPQLPTLEEATPTTSPECPPTIQPTISLQSRASLQLADQALRLLKAPPTTSPPRTQEPSSTPPSTHPEAPSSAVRLHPTRSPTPTHSPLPRHGPDPAERDYSNGSPLAYITPRATTQSTAPPISLALHDLVASIRKEVELGCKTNPRRRRDQGHLSSPSTTGEISPPPPPQPRTPSPPCDSPTTTPHHPKASSRSMSHSSPSTAEQPSPPPSSQWAPPPPPHLPYGPPAVITQPSLGGLHITTTHVPRIAPTPSTNNMREGRSVGPYNWYGPSWLTKHPPLIDQNRSMGPCPPLGNWVGWGEGPRGKGKETPSRPPITTSARPVLRGSRIRGPTGPLTGNNNRGGLVPTTGQPSRGFNQPYTSNGPHRHRVIQPGSGESLTQPNPSVNHLGIDGGVQPGGGGGPEDALFPRGPLSMNPNDNTAPVKLFSKLLPYTERLLSDTEWSQWCSLLDCWTQGFSKWFSDRSKPPTPTPQAAWARRQQDRRPNERRPNTQQDRSQTRNRAITRMVAVQKAYRQNPKRCMAMLRKSPPPVRCNIPIATVETYFLAKQNVADPSVPMEPPPFQLWQDTTPTDLLEVPITSQEVLTTLRRTNLNSAPGPDRLPYAAWKRLEPIPNIVTSILNTCRINAKIPPSWKGSNTILIHKGDSVNHLDNWRPIALQNTLYKVYASIIARRLSTWAISNNIVSPSQKGFLPVEGCLEHGFVLKSVLQDSRRNKREACIAWLDLKDAFGSVPHPVLLETLRLAGLQGSTLDVIKDIYTNSTTSVKTSSATSTPIICRRGVKQGCPLSPILFDLIIEVIIRAMDRVPKAGYRIAHSTVRSLTYADDLCAFASSPAIMQQMLTGAQNAATWAGLTFNPRKCAILSIVRGSGKRQRVDRPQPSISGEPVPTLPWDGQYKYLGCTRGADPNSDLTQAANDYLSDCKVILESELTDWQKIDAIKRFARPRMTYLLQNMEPTISWARSIDQELKSLAKMCFKLPNRATTSYFYAQTKAGGLALPRIEDEIHLFRISTAYKVLFAQGDAQLRDISTSALGKTAEIRTRNQKSAQTFLNDPADPGEGRRGDIKSLWSEVRSSLQHCRAKFNLQDQSITCDGITLGWSKRRNITGLLRNAIQSRYVEDWKRCPDQGRAVICTSAHPASNHWVTTGRYTSFGEYRFAIKARLNLLTTRTSRFRAGDRVPDRSCRRCNSEQETLAHVLNHCPTHVGLLRKRHNNILARLSNAIPVWRGKQFKEQGVPGDNLGLKPDLVILDDTKKEAFVIDVTMPFEGNGSFAEARQAKERKYGHLKALLNAKGYNRVEVDAFIVGPLGSWDPANDPVLHKLCISRRYAILFRKLCCTEALKGSFGIWKAFTEGHPPNS